MRGFGETNKSKKNFYLHFNQNMMISKFLMKQLSITIKGTFFKQANFINI